MKNIIIEGLSGAGKSTLLNKLENELKLNSIKNKIFYEDETFGEFATEVKNRTIKEEDKLYRLKSVLSKIDELTIPIILERFHLSYYALLKNWNLYKDIDKNLKEKNFFLVLLTYNDNLILERALQHNDLEKKDLSPFIEYFGSLENALQQYKESQENRKEALSKTSLEVLEIDTSKMDWDKYINIIINKLDNI